MVVDAARAGDARTAGEVAVVLTERGLGGDAVDLTSRLDAFGRDPSQRAEEARRLAGSLARRAREARAVPSPLAGEGGPKGRMRGGREAPPLASGSNAPQARALTPGPSPARGEGRVGALLASAYPERIAMARGKRGEVLMANGRAASLEPHDALAGEPFLAIGEVAGRAAAARILLAAPLTLDDIETVAGASIETAEELSFDRPSASLRARRRWRLGALILAEQTLAVPPDEQSSLALARGVLSLGVGRLPWSKAVRQWRDRVMFLRRSEGEPWPDLSDERLSE